MLLDDHHFAASIFARPIMPYMNRKWEFHAAAKTMIMKYPQMAQIFTDLTQVFYTQDITLAFPLSAFICVICG